MGVADCIKHIAVTEAGLWQMTNGTIQAPPIPKKRSEVKATDRQVVNRLKDRSHKSENSYQLEPQNTVQIHGRNRDMSL